MVVNLCPLLLGTDVELRWAWLPLLLGSLVVGMLVWWSRRDAVPGPVLHVSHTHRVAALPRFAALVRRRRRTTAVQVVASLLVVAGCLLLVARPSEGREESSRPNRDVLVCLDTSNSMLPINAAVVDAVRRVVGSLPGDRVGLSIFDGTTVVKFPLTDDRGFVDEALDTAQEAFRKGDFRYDQAAVGDVRSSQVGDGLHACVRGFDRLEERRGRVVLVVSDNEPYGRPVHTLAEAAAEARTRDVVVHALGAPGLESRPAALVEFRRAVERTGGSLTVLENEDAVDGVIERIDEVERRRLQEPPRRLWQDRPEAGLGLLLAGTALLAGCWLRRRP